MSGFERHGYRFTGYRTRRLDKLEARKARLYSFMELRAPTFNQRVELAKGDQWSRVILKINKAIKREQAKGDRIDRIYNWLATDKSDIIGRKWEARDRAQSDGFYPQYTNHENRVDRVLGLLRKLKGWDR